jgi:hypothetical protein
LDGKNIPMGHVYHKKHCFFNVKGQGSGTTIGPNVTSSGKQRFNRDRCWRDEGSRVLLIIFFISLLYQLFYQGFRAWFFFTSVVDHEQWLLYIVRRKKKELVPLKLQELSLPLR